MEHGRYRPRVQWTVEEHVEMAERILKLIAELDDVHTEVSKVFHLQGGEERDAGAALERLQKLRSKLDNAWARAFQSSESPYYPRPKR